MNHITYIKREWYTVDTLPKKYNKMWQIILKEEDGRLEEYDGDVSITEWQFIVEKNNFYFFTT